MILGSIRRRTVSPLHVWQFVPPKVQLEVSYGSPPMDPEWNVISDTDGIAEMVVDMLCGGHGVDKVWATDFSGGLFRYSLRNAASTATSINTYNTSITISGALALSGIPSLTELALPYQSGLASLTAIPPSVTSLWLSGSGLTALPTLPSSLTGLSVDSSSGLSSLPSLPTPLVSLNASYCNLSTYEVDNTLAQIAANGQACAVVLNGQQTPAPPTVPYPDNENINIILANGGSVQTD